MRLLIMGSPGAGKGTQATLISQTYNIPHISTGDMFRKAIDKETEIGLQAKGYIDKGFFVSDDITINLVKERLKDKDCSNGFLLDGFPRTVIQAIEFDKILNESGHHLDVVINIIVSDKLLIERVTGRRVCTNCNTTYHIKSNSPKTNDICDICDSQLVQRLDDTEETIKNRLEIYYQKTQPVLDYYKAKNLVEDVYGMGDIEEVFQRIENVMKRHFS